MPAERYDERLGALTVEDRLDLPILDRPGSPACRNSCPSASTCAVIASVRNAASAIRRSTISVAPRATDAASSRAAAALPLTFLTYPRRGEPLLALAAAGLRAGPPSPQPAGVPLRLRLLSLGGLSGALICAALLLGLLVQLGFEPALPPPDTRGGLVPLRAAAPSWPAAGGEEFGEQRFASSHDRPQWRAAARTRPHRTQREQPTIMDE